ncbi:hypothetical protein [Pelagibius sp. 7325]|uniref:hypothetical protein n=1 Tax=Pelagibius sp. 7325 TaxID=3131994 RepID=UPI0030EC9F08
MRHVVFVLCFAGFLGGCAIGNSHRYDLGDADLKVESDKSVAVAVVDLRPYVLSGEKEPRFSGLFRGGFGNPFDVTTDSGRPLTEDLSQSVVTALKRSGVDAVTVAVAPKTATAEARALVQASGADRCALLQVREWKSDTYFNTGLTYDLTLDVLAGDGTLLASKEIQGHDNLGPAGVPGDARVQVERAVKEKLETLFANPDIKNAVE